MSTLVSIADAVAESLNSGPWGLEAERHYRPAFDLENLDELRVSVVPRSQSIQPASRSATDFEVQIDIGIQQRIQAEGIGVPDAILSLVEAIADHLRFDRLEAMPEAVWVGSTHEPVFVPELYDQHRVFTSVLTVSYRVRR